MSKKIFYTPVKRSHLITTSGVGALVRTRNGVTALVRGLADWQSRVPVQKHLVGADRDIARERFLRSLTLRDPELENACKVSRFIQPQSLPDDPTFEDWLVPVVRFPLAGFCSNWQCGRIIISKADNPNTERCSNCTPQKPKPVQQIPIFKVCKSGHIEEIDWQAVIHENCLHNCGSKKMKAKLGNSIKRIIGECLECGCKSNPDDYVRECSGVKAWLPESTPDICAETMHVVERTSVQVYYANIKSALHLPNNLDLNDVLLEWILNQGNIDHIDLNSEIQINGFLADLKNVNIEVSVDEFKSHVLYLKNKINENTTAEWDKVDSRARELDVLTSELTASKKNKSSLLQHENIVIDTLSPELFGTNGLIEKVVAISKLTETRIQDGFSRFTPDMPTTRQGQKLLWGLGDVRSPWLPGYRVYGEGILFVLNKKLVLNWQNSFQDISKTKINRETLAHTFAHIVLAQSALECGYQIAGIRDRIYDLSDGRLAFLIYAAEGDSVGTLGGLVELSRPTKIEGLIRDALNHYQWCSQDPVCISESTYQIDHNPGACHQCVLLPETSCELFNSNLDRASIFGFESRGVPAFYNLKLN